MIINVKDCGAHSADRLMTEPIQHAIDACFLAGGGEVVIPAGYYRTGDLRLRSNVTLHLLSGAYLEGSEDPEDYGNILHDTVETPPAPGEFSSSSADPSSRWSHGLIRAYRAEHIAVIGDPYSCIDGRNVYDAQGEEHYRGPHGINFWYCRDVTLRGYTMRNTGNWAHAIFFSERVTCENITVLGGHDGFDIFLCEDVRVQDCTFDTGDDCIAGFGSKNVTVRRCTLNSSCSAIRFGGTDVLFEDCETHGPASYGFRGRLHPEEKARSTSDTSRCSHGVMNAFLYYCDARFGELPYQPGNITLRRCIFENTDTLFRMDFGQHIWCCQSPLTSIAFEDCTLTGAHLPIYIHGDPDVPTDFSLSNVTLSPAEDNPSRCFLDAEQASLTMKNVTLKGYDEPVMILRSDIPVRYEDSTPCRTEEGKPGASGIHGN